VTLFPTDYLRSVFSAQGKGLEPALAAESRRRRACRPRRRIRRVGDRPGECVAARPHRARREL